MKHLLASTSFFVVNKYLAKKIGLKPSVLLADLISKEQYFRDNNQCAEGWFFNSAENITKDTTLTRYEQDKSLKKLVDLGFVDTKVKGIPAIKHFKIIEDKIVSYLQTSFKETKQHDCEVVTTNNNKKIKLKNNNITIRQQAFRLEVLQFLDESGIENDIVMLEDFILFWTEPNKSNTKMRYELQKTWDTNRRLKTWKRNDKKWNKPTGKLTGNLNTLNSVKERLKKL